MVPITNITGRLGNQMFQFAFLLAYARDNDLDHYFQNPAFFGEYDEEIRQLFSKDMHSPIDAVAIHIRRGGNPHQPNEPKYYENPFYVNLFDTHYYEKAIAMFPDEKFVIFTDDPEWVENNWILFDKSRMTISHGTEIEDMNNMAACKAHIIANSTFSWWGAWLSPKYPHNRVIAPKNWFADGVERTVLPNHWEKI